jgi:hypothetical protein
MSVSQNTSTETAYWQAVPCPHWCQAVHGNGDFDGDRIHYGEPADVPLSTADPIQGYEDDSRMGDFLRVHLDQHYREAGPRVYVDRNEASTDYVLTLDEAEQLARTLLLLVAQARS